MNGFNNFEQGILIACALASMFSLMWLAIIFTTACLRTIDMVHHFSRMASALERILAVLEVGVAGEIAKDKQDHANGGIHGP